MDSVKKDKTDDLLEDSDIQMEKYLTTGGIQWRKALSYLNHEVMQYQELIKLFMDEKEKKQQELLQLMVDGNMKNYSILVHALKTNARGLGADELADQAYDLELQSKAGHDDYVKEHHEIFIRKWNEIVDIFQEYLVHADTKCYGYNKNNREILELKNYSEDQSDLDCKEKGYMLLGQDADLILHQLRESLENFEYEKALELLEEIDAGRRTT